MVADRVDQARDEIDGARLNQAVPAGARGVRVNFRNIAVADLDLDTRNPRHGPVPSQEAAIKALVDEQTRKQNNLLTNLALDIHEYGLNPTLRFTVLEEPTGRFTVLDGNRRLAALRLLEHPELLPPDAEPPDFAERVAQTGMQPHSVDCYVVQRREEADVWLERTHQGQLDGIGTRPWTPAAQHRWRPLGRPTQTSRAIDILDWLRPRVAGADVLQRHIGFVERNATTNLGRLAQTKVVQRLVGFQFDGHDVVADASEPDLARRLSVIVSDLASGRAVTEIHKKEQRESYVRGLLGSDLHEQQTDDQAQSEDAHQDEGQLEMSEQTGPVETGSAPDGQTTEGATAAANDMQSPERPVSSDRPQAPRLFREVHVDGLHHRTQSIFRELRNLDLFKFPNAAAVLLRSAIELSVDEHLEALGRRPAPDTELAKRIRASINELAATSPGDKRFEAVQTDLGKQYSLVSARNLNQYVHNLHNAPIPKDLETISVNYAPLIEGISAAVASRRAAR